MTQLTTVISPPDVVLAETLGHAFDAAWIDLEHGALGARDVAPPAARIADEVAAAARAGGARVRH